MVDRDPNFVATIYARNQRFTAWKSVMVQRSFGTGISQFQFAAAEGYYGQKMLGLQIAPGDPVTIALAGQLAFTGYCTTRAGAYDKASHSVILSGDSKTVDLAHSSVKVQPGTYDGSTFQQAAQAVLAPHPVSLVISNPPEGASQPFKSLAPQYGETVAAFITRIAAARNMLIGDDASGNLVVGQAAPGATSSATLIEGKNILSANFKIADPSASSFNKLNGVSQAPASDDAWPSRAYSATASYSTVRANVFGLFVAEHPDDTQGLVSAVTHQAMRSLWPEIEVEITVVGWLRPDGKLWAPAPDSSGSVAVYSPLIFPNQTGMAILAIQAVRFQQDSQNGTTTALTLRRQSALTSSATAGVGDSTGATPQTSPDTADYQVST